MGNLRGPAQSRAFSQPRLCLGGSARYILSRMSESHPRNPPRIALVRHARSSHVHRGWIDAAGFRTWREAYEAAGIQDGERAPASLADLAKEAGFIVASDAPRAAETARLLAPGRDIGLSPLLRELDLESPGLGGVRLPLLAWAFAVGGRILAQTIRGRYPPSVEVARINAAATWLENLAVQNGLVVAVTHASFRRRLAARLVKDGWQAEPGRRSVRHWSTWLFTQPTVRT